MVAQPTQKYTMMQKAKCIVEYKYYNKSIRAVAKNQGIPKSTVHRWIKKDNENNGNLNMKKPMNEKKQRSEKNKIMGFIEETINKRPYITMEDLAALIRNKHDVSFSGRTISFSGRTSHFFASIFA